MSSSILRLVAFLLPSRFDGQFVERNLRCRISPVVVPVVDVEVGRQVDVLRGLPGLHFAVQLPPRHLPRGCRWERRYGGLPRLLP